MKFNDSSFRFIGQTLKTNRTRLLRTKSRLYCPECQTVQQVTDFFPSKEALLHCGHRRHVIEPEVIAAFEQEKATRGRSRTTGWQGGGVMQIENVEEKAA